MKKPSVLMSVVLCAVIGTFAISIPLCQSAELPEYDIGGIPDKMVHYGEYIAFRVLWEGHPDAVVTMWTSPSPAGHTDLNQNTQPGQEGYIFVYAPHQNDKTAFSVTLTALDEGKPPRGGETYSHTFEITPTAGFPSEATVFKSNPHTQPVSRSGISVIIEENPVPETFNYTLQKTKNITLIGDVIVIEKNHENELFENYFAETIIHTKEMVIIGEKVIFRSAARVKGANVTIYAKELRFEGNGALKTTPEENTVVPGMSGNGDPGLDAGRVDLHVGSFYSEKSGVIDLTGGRGQNGGPGAPGKSGNNCEVVTYGSVSVTDWPFSSTYENPNYYGITYYTYTAFGITWARGGASCLPTDGDPATPPGIPGNGRNGGSISTNIDIGSSSFINSGGDAGAPSLPPSGYTKWRGGYAGYPTQAVMVHFVYRVVLINYWTQPSPPPHETEAGTSYDVTHGVQGNSGGGLTLVSPQPYAWMHPQLVRKILIRAKEKYLSGQIMEAKSLLLEYTALLEDYMAHSSYAESIDSNWQHDLEVVYNEMQTLLHRIQSNLDYFGNPAGWVPMLSFEVTQAMFDTEIDRAINMLYLSYWIGNKAKNETERLNALKKVRDHLWAEFEAASAGYNDNVTNKLPLVLAEGNRLENQTWSLQNELEVLETELLNQATNTVGTQPWEIGVRLGMKASAMMCKALPIPYVQPMLGELGGGLLDMVGNMDFQEPWNSLYDLPDIADSYTNTKYKQAADGLNRKMLGVKDQPDAEKKRKYWKEWRRVTGGVSDGVKDIRGYIEELGEPQSEVLAAVDRLKEEDAQYTDIVERIKQHLEEKTLYAQNLAELMQKISSQANIVDENIMAVDALSREIADGIIVDPRAALYLESLEKRAYDRLLKYHYYMSKAYEYRLLEPYTQALDLQALIDEFAKIGNANHEITPAQFDSFKGVYQDILAGVAETIYDKYIANPPDLSAPVEFNLTADELARLNNGEPLRLNLWERNGNELFFNDEENIRIVNLTIAEIATEPQGGPYGSSARVRVQLEHVGFSNLKLDGVVRQFRHYNQDTKAAITWAGVYDPVGDVITPIAISEGSNSLLRSLLSTNAQSDMLLYSRPAAWADLDVKRSVTGNSGRGITIKHLRMKLQYDYTPRNVQLGLWDIKVVPCPYPTWGRDLTPYFALSRADINNRQDGWGRFLRIFRHSNAAPVSIQAQEILGSWVFQKWADKYGNDLPGGPFTNPTINLYPNKDRTVCAAYQNQENVPDTTDTDHDGLSDSLENGTCTDTYDADTDDDGIPDGVEDANGNGIRDRGETDPCNADTDGDGVQDGTEMGYTLAMVSADTDLSIFIPDPTPGTVTNPLVNPALLTPVINYLLMDEEEKVTP